MLSFVYPLRRKFIAMSNKRPLLCDAKYSGVKRARGNSSVDDLPGAFEKPERLTIDIKIIRVDRRERTALFNECFCGRRFQLELRASKHTRVNPLCIEAKEF